MAKLHPIVKWAQDKRNIFLTVELGNITNDKINLEESSLDFDVVGGTDKKPYAFTLNFNKEVKKENSRIGVPRNSRNLLMVLAKKDEGFWQRLTQEEKKPHWLKTDWDRMKDSDESDNEEPDGNFEDVMKQLGNFEQPAVPEDVCDDEDSDDDMPDLTDS